METNRSIKKSAKNILHKKFFFSEQNGGSIMHKPLFIMCIATTLNPDAEALSCAQRGRAIKFAGPC